MFPFDFFARLKSFLGLDGNNPQKKQIFDFFWNIEVFNASPKSVQGELFLPLPLELSGQKIIGEIVFTPAADKTTAEETYHNRYASWKILLKPEEKKYFFCRFKAELFPKKFAPKNGYFLDDYILQEEDRAFLSPNRFINPDQSEISRLAQEIIQGEKDAWLIIKKMNDHVAARLKYGRPILGLYSAADALKKEAIDCGGFASLLVSLCLSLGIPARIVSGFWAGYANNAMHVWAEIKLPDGSWIPADPTVENLRISGRTKKTGRLGFIGSDRIIFSQGCDLEIETLEGKIKIDILQNPFYKGTREENIKIKHNLKTE